MKKMMLLCVCLLLVAVMAVPVFAANETTFTATASKTTLYRGETVTLTVNASSTEQATSYGLALDYDTSVFELVDGACTVSGTGVSSFNDGFAFMFLNPTAFTGTVGTVTLKVKDNAAFGDTSVVGEASVKNGTADIAATGCAVELTIVCNHSYGVWAESGAGHAKTCTICNDVKVAEHTWDNGVEEKKATCTEEGKKVYTCTDCSATKDEAVEMIAHTYGPWEAVDDANHKHTCAACPKEETVAHEFAQELTAGDDAHWFACICGAKKDETEHAFDEATWVSDTQSHYHVCACGARADEVAHTWDEGKVTTEASIEKEGVKTFTCQECAAVKTEAIAKLPTNPKTGDDAIIIPFVLLMLLSGCGIVITLTARKRMVK